MEPDDVVGTLLILGLMNAFSNLLRGDGALGVVFGAFTGAVLPIPVALIFAVLLAVIRSGRRARRRDGRVRPD